jgi:uncharacterized repeat protein (TIGR01451 family)
MSATYATWRLWIVLIVIGGGIGPVVRVEAAGSRPQPAFGVAALPSANEPGGIHLSAPLPSNPVTYHPGGALFDDAPPAEGAAPEALQGSDWLAEAVAYIEASEYRFSARDGIWTAPNREQGLRLSFEEAGMRVAPRIPRDSLAGTSATGRVILDPMSPAKAGAWAWSIRLVGVGRAGDVSPVADTPRLSGEETRITVHHRISDEDNPVALTEWYVNEPRGLEHGFTLQAPPASASNAPLVLDLALAGDLIAEPVDAATVHLTTHDRVLVLRYGDVFAYDAAGRSMHAFLEVGPDGMTIRVVVEDDDAVYPLTIDPLLTSPWAADPADTFDAELGSAVSSIGDLNGDGYEDFALGAPGYGSDTGQVWISHGSADGPVNALNLDPDWEPTTVDQDGANLGYSVSGAGDVNDDGYDDVLVGAPNFDGGVSGEGRAFLYLGSVTGLETTPAWSGDPTDQVDAGFGHAVTGVGDVDGDGYDDWAIGAPRYANEGIAYLYLGAATLSGVTASWAVSPTRQTDALFGWAVAAVGDVNGDTRPDLAVSAPYFDGAATDEGRAYLFLSNSGGLPNTTPDWTADPSDQTSAHFGDGLASAGDVNCDGKLDLVVGAPGFDNENTDEGAVYVYFGTGSGLSTSPDWHADPADQDDAHFGATVGPIAAGTCQGIIAGAPDYDNTAYWANDAGVIYAFPVYTSTLNSARYCTSMAANTGTRWGRALNPAGDTDGNGVTETVVGAARFYRTCGTETAGGATVLETTVYGSYPWCGFTGKGGLQPIDAQDLAAIGYDAAGAGDVNGDGYDDVILGAPEYNTDAHTDAGTAYVYYGSPFGLMPDYSISYEVGCFNVTYDIQDDRTLSGERTGDRFGASLAAAGDVNKDGYDDLLVGAPGYDGENVGEGRAYLYYGTPSGLTWSPVWHADPADAGGAQFGKVVGGAGDVNGDTYADLIIGAPTLTTTLASEGRAYVYHGSADGPSDAASPDWTLDPVDETEAHFGAAVGTAGDVDDDGYDDVIVGAPGANAGLTDQGAAYVFSGSASGLGTSAWWSGTGGRAGAHYGFAVGTAGSVNGDAYADWIVGAPDDDAVATGQGRADVYLGGASAPTTVSWTGRPTGTQANVYYGTTVGAACDVGNDGYDDIVVGGPGYVGYTHEGTDIVEGRAYVYYGSGGGLATVPSWATDPTNQDGAEFGSAVSGGGDVDGDGYADVLVGAPSYYRNSSHGHEGRAYVYFGTARGLEPDVASDWRADPSTVTDERNGYAVSTAGDVNGDGYDDVAVAAYCATGSSGLCGHVYVYHGSAAGVSAPDNPAWDAANPGTNSQFFARAVSTAGDVNNDGYDDLLVGNPDYIHTPSEIYTGAVHLYLGSATGLSGTVTITEPASTNIAQSWFGQAVAAAGDVDKDGYDDVVVGAPYASPAGNGEGMAFVYYGDANGIHAQYSPMDTTDEYGAGFGTSVSGAGDVNGDGYGDVIVGAPWQDGWHTDGGALYVYHGSASGVGITSDWGDSPEASQSWYKVGSSVSAAGDLNADGYDDIIAGGRDLALVYYGSSTGLDSWNGPDWVLTSEHLEIDAENGNWPVAGAGDFNGDSYDDVLVGIPFYDGQNFDEGAAVIYYGTSCGELGDPTAPDWIASPTESDYVHFGSAVASAGDVNGDGVDDVLAGAPEYDTDVGRAYLFQGVQAPPLVGLSVSKWDDPDPVAVGELLTYTVVVSNVCGTTTATHVLLTDTLPSVVDFHTVATTQGTCTPGIGEVECDLGSLANESIATVTLTVTPTVAGTITNTVAVAADQEDRSLSDNTDQAATDVFLDPCETILLEPFEGGSTPSGWSVVDNQGNGQVWRFDNPGSRFNLTGGSSGFAIVDSDHYGGSGSQDTELQTPSLDFSSSAYGFLTFDTDFNRIGSEVSDVDVSVDGGATWINVWRKLGSYRGPAHETVDLTALAGASDARIRFRYYDASYAWWWEVDNVEVRRCASPNGVAIAPPAALQTGPRGGTVTYKLTVSNTGSLSDTYSVSQSGNAWATTAPASVGPLAPGHSEVISVTVSVPSGATPGSTDTVVITATSTAGEGSGPSATATLTTTANRAPVALADTYVVTKGMTLSVAAPGLLANDNDPDGDPLTVQLQSNVSHGSLSIGTDGAFSYIPGSGYLGEDTFTYQASDGYETSAEVTVTLDVISPYGGIGDRVWRDADLDGFQDGAESGVPNVQVTLFTAAGVLSETTNTDASGYYSFTDLMPGDYYVQFVPPGGYQFSPRDQGLFDSSDSDADPATGKTITTTLSANEYDATWDAGIYRLATVGDRLWEDANYNGYQDAGEHGVFGITVTLRLSGTTAPHALAVTDAKGHYSFTVAPGHYALHFSRPAGMIFTRPDLSNEDADSDVGSGGNTPTFDLGEGVTNLDWDAGVVRTASVGDFVWHDVDEDGIQDSEEFGQSGVTVELYNGSGIAGTTTTDVDGAYRFDNLAPDNYYLKVVPPANWHFSVKDNPVVTDDEDSDADPTNGESDYFTLDPGENDTSWDAGIYPEPSAVGDRVWHDADTDGVQDIGESGYPSATVSLYMAGAYAPLRTTTTDATGGYRFQDVQPGPYCLEFTMPHGWLLSPRDAGTQDALDSDADRTTGRTVVFTLTAGITETIHDAGLYRYVEQSVVNPGSDSSLVYTDTQGNATTVHVPGDAVTRTTTLFYTPFSVSWSGLRAQHAGQTEPVFAHHAFRLDGEQEGNVLTALEFAGPLTVTIAYSEADVEGIEEDQFLLYRWDAGTGGWIDATLPCLGASSQTVKMEVNELVTEICALGRYGLFGPDKGGVRVYLPLALKNR